MKKRIKNRNENSLILIGKSKIMGQIATDFKLPDISTYRRI